MPRKRKAPLSGFSDEALLDELGSRFQHWMFFGRKDTSEGDVRWGKWRGDSDICMGGAFFLAHDAACSIDTSEEPDEIPLPEDLTGYL